LSSRAEPGIWIAGAPGAIGGATTELDHLIDLLLGRGVPVHVVPTWRAGARTVADLLARGCTVHSYRPDVFRDGVVLSFGNVRFLHRLPEIVRAGRPRRVIWFNCNNWMLDGEAEAHRNGWLDAVGFVSRYQEAILRPQLEQIAPVPTFGYRPYLNLRRIPFAPRPPDRTFRVGRISRDDALKFPDDMWHAFSAIRVPPRTRKLVLVLGYGPAAAGRVGPPPPDLDVTLLAPGSIPARRLYAGLDVLLYKTGGWSESYCRVVVEAQAHGVVPVVPDDYAFPELVVPGSTGFLARTTAEMSEYATWLAHHPRQRMRMARRGRRRVEQLVSEPVCWAPWPAIMA
jgi:glycosyltransferase involved in cell wall biosynthesis